MRPTRSGNDGGAKIRDDKRCMKNDRDPLSASLSPPLAGRLRFERVSCDLEWGSEDLAVSLLAVARGAHGRSRLHKSYARCTGLAGCG